MKAIVVNHYGGPEVLQWEEVPTPSPGPGEVLVRVHSVSVNRTLDLQVRQDGRDYGGTLPMILGNDPSGVVAEAGREVTNPRVDDRVAISQGIHCQACQRCLEGNPSQCSNRRMLGIHCWGGYAEYVKVPATNCVPIPEGLSFAEATVVARHFPLAFGEAHKAGLKEGDWALVMGAAGGLGSCLVQVGKNLGARVIAGAGADERVASGRSLGAEFGINYRREDLEKEVMRITEGHGVDVVFENIGDPVLFPAAFRCLARGGRLVTAGAHGGGQVTLDVSRLYRLRLQVMSGLGTDRSGDLERALDLTAKGEFQALISRVMPLRQAEEAHRLVESNEPLGKIILDPTLKYES